MVDLCMEMVVVGILPCDGVEVFDNQRGAQEKTEPVSFLQLP